MYICCGVACEYFGAYGTRPNRPNRVTVDMIFVLRQIRENCREQNMGLYAAFVNLTKAFDTVSHDGLWKILSRLGCPPNFLQIPASPMKVSKVR